MRWPWQRRYIPLDAFTDWHAHFTRVSVELGTELRNKKALEDSNAALGIEVAELERKVLDVAQSKCEIERQATEISVLRSQVAAEMRSNQALRGVVTRMKKSRTMKVPPVLNR